MICDLINFGIPLTVTSNVRQTTRRFWIGPEVRRLTHVIMLISARRRSFFVDNRKWTLRKSLLRIAFKLRPGSGNGLVTVMNALSH